jgi:ATP-dependent DNA helicase RecG
MNSLTKKEDQHTEFKTIWKDEFLKHICAFSNAQGGTLFIGKDDHGSIVGLNNSKKLLEEIPNKTIQFLGLVVHVNSHTENDLN